MSCDSFLTLAVALGTGFAVVAIILTIEIRALFREIHRDEDGARRGPRDEGDA